MKHTNEGETKPSPLRASASSSSFGCPCSGSLDFPLFCRATGLKADDSLPNWSSLQTFSFLRWTSTLCRSAPQLHPCAHFVRRILHIVRGPEVASAKALFLLPVPKEGVFVVSRSAGSRERRRRSFDQAVHITVMASNFLVF